MRPLVAASMAFVTIAMVQRLFAMVFVLNLDVAGPNATAGLAALLVTAPAWRIVPANARILLAALAIAAVTLASLGTAAWAAGGAVLAMLAMAPLWRTIGDERDGIVVGVLAWMTLHALLGGLSPFQAAPWLIPVLALPMLAWGRLDADTTAAPASLWAFLVVQACWLGALPSLWRWADSSPSIMAAASAGGLAVGLFARHLSWGRGWPQGLFVLAAAVSLGALTPALGVFVAQVAAVRMLGEGGGLGRLAMVQGLAVVFLFMHVVAGNWAFVGFVPEALSRGLAGLYMFLLLTLLPLASWRRA